MRVVVGPLVAAGVLLLLWLGAPVAGRAVPNVPPARAQSGYSGRLVLGRTDGVWLLPLDGSPPSRIAPLESGSNLTGVGWAPDGERIAYTRLDFAADGSLQGSDVHLVGLDHGDRVLVPPDVPASVFGRPAWTPDGAAVLFDVTSYGGGSGGPHIDRVGVDGGGRTTVVASGYAPSLSADGRWLAYQRRESGGMAILVRDLSGGAESVALAPSGSFDVISPALSPDGSSVAFAQPAPDLAADGCPPPAGGMPWLAPPVALAHGTPKELWRAPPSGGGAVRLTSGLCLDDPALAWSPDGAWLAAYGGTSLVLVRADGSSPVPVWHEGSYGGVDWAP